MKIGVFGGTFNPIHNGHLINAQVIKDNYSLDKVLFVPSKYPVHKNLDSNVSAEHRFEMIKLATQDNAGFNVTRIEIDRSEKSYTITTIKQLSDTHTNASFYLIIGSDAFNEIETWKDYIELTQLTSFIVMKRPGTEQHNKRIINLVKHVEFADNPIIDISSSKIRENIRKGLSIKNLVPQSVEKYIKDKELYRSL